MGMTALLCLQAKIYQFTIVVLRLYEPECGCVFVHSHLLPGGSGSGGGGGELYLLMISLKYNK